MAESWVRLWAGMTTDPKWKTIARKSGRPLVEVIAVFAHAMLIANDAEERGELEGWVTEDVASAMDMDEEHVTAIYQAMLGRVIDDDGRLSGWDRRQPVREDSGNEKTGAMSAAERKRLQREREAEMSRHVTQCHEMSRPVTQCHAPDTEAEAEAEAEKANTHTVETGNPEPVDNFGGVRVSPQASDDQPTPTQAGAACRAMRQAGIADGNPSHPTLLALLDAGATPEEFRQAAVEAHGKGKGFAYAIGTVKRRREEAAKLVLHKGRLPNKQEALEASNRAVGIEWERKMREQMEVANAG